MAFVGSYLWRLRQKIGSELVLMPGAMVALLEEDDRVLLTRRRDSGLWCLPAGSAEVGGSFAKTAVDELLEEVGVHVSPSALIPFGCLSEADFHMTLYPNGDLTHCFAMCFLARQWRGEPRRTWTRRAVQFADLNDRPNAMDPPARQRSLS